MVIDFGTNSRWGNYIVDFLCLQKRVIIEVDGGQHAQEKNHDAEWDAWLREQVLSLCGLEQRCAYEYRRSNGDDC